MSDGRVLISSEPGLNPDDVAQRTFATAFRGYDQHEVRLFLKRVRDELAAARERERELRHWLDEERHRAAHPEVDEATLMHVLGEEAARVLSTAKEAAADIRSNAEEKVARMLREAEERVAGLRSAAEADGARIRAEAEGLLAARTEDADRAAAAIRQATEAEAAALIAQARAEAEAEVEAARARGRDMVNEAQALRERVLGDLVRRRNQARVQVEQLRAGRERLLEAYKVVRRTLDDATTELTTAETEARTAADHAGRRASNDLGTEAGDIATVEAELAALEATRPPSASMPPPPPAPEPAPDPVVVPEAESAPLFTPAPAPPAPEPIPAPAVVDATPAPSDVNEGFRVVSAATPAPEPDDLPAVRSVDDLFARIKADRAGAVAKAEYVLATVPSAEDDGAAVEAEPEPEPVVDEDESLRQRRDTVLEPLEATLVRKLKRALQDEQNELLDALRTHRGKGPATSLLPAEQAQLERYCQVAAPLLEEAARHGARFAGSDGLHGGERPAGVAAELAGDLVGFLRDRVEQALGDEADAVDRLGASYRQCKTQRVDRVARHHLASAFSLGTLAGATTGTTLRWVVDDDGGPCPDCDDNALAGPVPVGDEFPTGQRRPPAHAGCRCVLAPAGSVPERQRGSVPERQR